MKKLWILLGVLLLQLVTAPAAEAQFYDLNTAYKPSAQWFAVELKFGPYKPDIDTEFGGEGPYRDIFGRKLRLMTQLTFDVQFLKKHGTLGVGGTIGLFTAQGKALDELTGEKSADTTSINVVPLILQLVYRWDYAAKKWNVPLVPYVRAGVVYSFYWITKGSGKLARFSNGDKAHGGVWGYQVNVGLAFMLDALEPGSAKKLDSEMGVNHTYLFCEFVHSGIDNFGGDRLRLGMKYSLLAGLTAEF